MKKRLFTFCSLWFCLYSIAQTPVSFTASIQYSGSASSGDYTIFSNSASTPAFDATQSVGAGSLFLFRSMGKVYKNCCGLC